VFAPADYTFELPPELIAQEPTAQRDQSRLLHLHADGAVTDHMFGDIVEMLPADAILVVNDTRVIPARVLGHKDSGGRVELLFLEPEGGENTWRCLARARRPIKPGQFVRIDGTDISVELVSERDQSDSGSILVRVPCDAIELLERVGHIPLPRYIQREDDKIDRERYQTMFAKAPGAVAAPTAGLHMTPAILDRILARGITLASVTLHVGYGTFEPIRVEDVRQHHMHRERYIIPAETSALVATGRPVVALGTTAMRALESAATAPRTLPVGNASTELFIYPGSGHEFRVVDHLVTNFHLPESTLLMLVCAFAGTERVLAAYRHAVAQRYRFFSYGDAMLLHRDKMVA
jgi:S-adenosylmethionine:tRNA ribosyltransferase-isomerase